MYTYPDMYTWSIIKKLTSSDGIILRYSSDEDASALPVESDKLYKSSFAT